MPRAIWSGAISFGLVNIPVKLYSAVSKKTVRFHQIDGESGQRIQQQRVSPDTGEEVPYEQIVKGYEISPDRYVTITPEELDVARAAEDAHDRHRGLRGPRADRPDLLRPPVLPRPGQGRGEGLQAAARRDGGGGQGRDRARGDPLEGEPRGHPPATTACSRWRRCCSPTRSSPPDSLEELAADGDVKTTKRELDMAQAADRVALRRLRAEQVPRRVPRARARPDRAQGRRARRSRSRRPQPSRKEVPDLMAALEASHRRRRRARRKKRKRGASQRQVGQRPAEEEEDSARRSSVPPARRVEVEVEGRRLSLSNLDKVMYPEAGFTKGQVIDYYTRVAPVLLPHLRDRPLTLKRYPERRRGPVLLREAVPLAPPRLGAQRAGRAPHEDDRLLRLRRPADARLARQPGRPRAAPVAVARCAEVERPTVMAFDLDPGAGPPASPSAARWPCSCATRSAQLGLESLPEDLGLEGHPGLRAAERATTWTTTTAPSRSRRRSRATSRRSTRS